jgi:hypothetical protein
MNTPRKVSTGFILKMLLVVALVGGAVFAWRRLAPDATGYVRLWAFKESLADPQKTQTSWTRDGLTVRFAAAGVTPEDFLQLGLRPIPVTALDGTGAGTSKLELFRVGSDQKRVPLGDVRLEWNRGTLAAMTFPPDLGQFLSPVVLTQYLGVIGRSKVDLAKKSSFLPKDHGLRLVPLAFPSREKVVEIFGAPRRSAEKVPLAYDTYELAVKGVGDVPKTLRADLYYQAWSGVFKYGQIVFSGYGILFDDGGVVVKR